MTEGVRFPFFSIGHSNRSLKDFVALLKQSEVNGVVDIRKIPKSRANPQFNRDTLPDALSPFDISYQHMAALGGLRGNGKHVAPEVNGFWTNQSFHNYADYALSGEFRAGLEHLLTYGRTRRCVMMCSEALWWRCHRRIVADHLMAAGEIVCHIMGHDRVEPARLTSGAAVQSDGTVIYPV